MYLIHILFENLVKTCVLSQENSTTPTKFHISSKYMNPAHLLYMQ